MIKNSAFSNIDQMTLNREKINGSTIGYEVSSKKKNNQVMTCTDEILIFNSNLSSIDSFLVLNLDSLDYREEEITLIPNGSIIHEKSCSVIHNDEVYFYGGFPHSKQISKVKSILSSTIISDSAKLRFDFVDGICASNDRYILLCFPENNRRLCYKSKYSWPREWWEWFTFVESSFYAHDSVHISSGKKKRTSFRYSFKGQRY